MNSGLNFKFIKLQPPLSDFVYSFSTMRNPENFKDGIIIPNGKIDLNFYQTTERQFKISLIGLETEPKFMPKQPIDIFFAVSFNPLGAEYILKQPTSGIVNKGMLLEENFWGFLPEDLADFKECCKKATEKIKSLIPVVIDERKRRLFELIAAFNGEIGVQELADRLTWSSRQINRYFNLQFGISLKAYCNIVRFQHALQHIKGGKLSPQLNFTDQSHFIKEVKRFSGVSPKELFKNQNDRFLQFLITEQT